MTQIVEIFGKQGTGKTLLMTVLGIMDYKREQKKGNSDYKIYSNYSLKEDLYVPIVSLSDIGKMRNGVFLFDEAFLWLSCRTSQSKINNEINKIIMLNRKRNVNIIYTTQRRRAVDVMLRAVTDYFLKPGLVKHEDNCWYLHYFVFDELERFKRERCLRQPIENYYNLYDTTEEISSLEEKSPVEKGIQLEEKFVSAIEKLGFDFIDRLANSGKESTWCYDVLAYKRGKCYAFDVKSVTGNRVTLKTYGHDLHARIRNAQDHGAKPFLVFPEKDCKQLSNPKFWYFHPLIYNDYLTTLSSYPSFNSLVKKSNCLTNILTIE